MASLWDDASPLSRRLPKVREKLSSLVRRGSTKTNLSTASGHHGVATIAPVLDVDLERVESFRLAEGWLEDSSSPPSPKRRHGRGGRRGDGARESEHREPELRYSATPIADLFSMSTDQLANTLETISRKPVPTSASSLAMPEPWSVAPPSTIAPAVGGAVPPEPQPIRISLRHSTVVDAVVTPEARSSTQSRRRTVMSWGNDAPVGPPASSSMPDEASQGVSQRHSVRPVGLLRSVGPNTTGLRVSSGGGSGSGSAIGDSTKRYSMASMSSPAELQLANRPPMPEIKTALPTPRNASMPTPTSTPTPILSPTDHRRRSWQPAAPLSAAPPPSVPAPAPTIQGSIGPLPRRTLTNRPLSAALTSSRLAWISELENKSSSSSSSGTSVSDIQRLTLKNPSGVAGKLAMFEHMQKQKQPPPPTLSRSNSTASSRISSAAMADSVFLVGDGPPSTARTSMDSTRSMHASHRNSAVMAYYDEGFREKMEGVAGGLNRHLQLNKKDEEVVNHPVPGPRKVTALLVEVEGEKTAHKEYRPADMEPAKEKVSEALELPAPAEEPSSAPLDGDGPSTVKIDFPEPVDVDVPEAQPANNSDAPVAGTEEPTVCGVCTDAEAEMEMEKPSSPHLSCAETKQPLVVAKEVADVLPQDHVGEGAREEILGVQVDPRGAQGGSGVVEEDEVQVIVEPTVNTQDTEAPSLEAER